MLDIISFNSETGDYDGNNNIYESKALNIFASESNKIMFLEDGIDLIDNYLASDTEYPLHAITSFLTIEMQKRGVPLIRIETSVDDIGVASFDFIVSKGV